MLAGLRQDGMIAPFVIDGAINRAAFEAYLAKVRLRLGNIVVMDNLSSHKGPRVRELTAAGTKAALPAALQPDFNPIEKAFAKLKSTLRKAAERTVAALWDRIATILGEITPSESANYFEAAGHDAD